MSTQGRGQRRAAEVVPAQLVERYEAMVDLEDGRIATERLVDLDASYDGGSGGAIRLPVA